MNADAVLLEEWKEVRETLRYTGNIRFAQLTVFMAATGVLLSAAAGHPDAGTAALLRIIGATLAFLFLMMEWGFFRFWARLAERGEEIERDGALATPPPAGSAQPAAQTLKTMTRFRSKRSLMMPTYAAFALYILTGLFWATGVLEPRLDANRIASRAIAAAPGYARDTSSQWNLTSLRFDAASGTYIVLLGDAASAATMEQRFDAVSGDVVAVNVKRP
jgi:hypothetical protein